MCVCCWSDAWTCSRSSSVCACVLACVRAHLPMCFLFSSFSSQTLQYCSHSSPGVFIERRVWTYLLLSYSPPSVSPSISCLLLHLLLLLLLLPQPTLPPIHLWNSQGCLHSFTSTCDAVQTGRERETKAPSSPKFLADCNQIYIYINKNNTANICVNPCRIT